MPHTRESRNVILVDDHQQLRLGVRVGLETSDDMHVSGEFSCAEDALAWSGTHRADVAVVDYQLPGIDGVEFVKALRDQGCDVPVVLLTAFRGQRIVERCLDAGANAFVSKESDLDTLLAAIDAVGAGRSYVDPTIAGELLNAPAHCLSRRETDVLGLMSEGLQNKQIARSLMLSEETVKSHVTAVMRKLDALSRTHAVAIGLRSGMLT